jgi:hypothetical protein
MRAEGIAAYAEPTPASTGGYMEQRLPSRPIDRLYVDDQKVDRAKELVRGETGDGIEAEQDFDAAWKQVLVSLQSPSSSDPVPPWPVSEDVDGPATGSPTISTGGSSYDETDDDENDDDHFVPPPPPPVPKLRPATMAAVLAIAAGLLLLATDFDGGSFRVVAILAVIGGGASLVWNMRQGPPTDSGWDDGAVV